MYGIILYTLIMLLSVIYIFFLFLFYNVKDISLSFKSQEILILDFVLTCNGLPVPSFPHLNYIVSFSFDFFSQPKSHFSSSPSSCFYSFLSSFQPFLPGISFYAQFVESYYMARWTNSGARHFPVVTSCCLFPLRFLFILGDTFIYYILLSCHLLLIAVILSPVTYSYLVIYYYILLFCHLLLHTVILSTVTTYCYLVIYYYILLTCHTLLHILVYITTYCYLVTYYLVYI